MHYGDTDVSPREQANVRERQEVSDILEKKRIEDFTDEDLQAILAVSGLWPLSSFAGNQPYAHLRRRARASLKKR